MRKQSVSVALTLPVQAPVRNTGSCGQRLRTCSLTSMAMAIVDTVFTLPIKEPPFWECSALEPLTSRISQPFVCLPFPGDRYGD